jgi:hypothetical protein
MRGIAMARRRRVEHQADQEVGGRRPPRGAWKVAYADFVTADGLALLPAECELNHIPRQLPEHEPGHLPNTSRHRKHLSKSSSGLRVDVLLPEPWFGGDRRLSRERRARHVP